MKKKRMKRFWLLPCLLMLLVGLFVPELGETVAAYSYDDARLFYESTGGDGYHTDVYGGNIYYATSARLASDSGNLKYGTVGYDIILSGNGQSVYFSVERNGAGSMQEITWARREYNGYEYNLYCISKEKLFELAEVANPVAAAVVRSAQTVHVQIDAIMTTKQNGTQHGGVWENGYGGVESWGDVYHLRDASALAKLRAKFSGHTFASFYDIHEYMENNQLGVRYKLDGGTVTGSYSSKDDVLYMNGNPVTTYARILEKMRLQSQNVTGLSKVGYHIEEGKEWIYDNRVFSQYIDYFPTDITPAVVSQNANIYMVANWQPNTYTIKYNANGGEGVIAPQTVEFTEQFTLRKGFKREGYAFDGYAVIRTDAAGVNHVYCKEGLGWQPWSEYKNQPGKWQIYDPSKNQQFTMSTAWVSESITDTFTFYAQWDEMVYKITTDKQGGTGGTDAFYEKYLYGWYADKTVKNEIDSITAPVKPGYTFLGYFTEIGKNGDKITEMPETEGGQSEIEAPNNRFKSDATVYAHWQANPYLITFDKQGGTGGSDTAVAIYNEYLPTATAPEKPGYTFMGYYTQKNGQGERYYGPGMGIYYEENGIQKMRKYTKVGDMTLYAYWEENSYTIVYSANGGTGSLADTKAVYGTSVNLRAINGQIKRNSYVLQAGKEWNTKRDGSGTYYADGASVKNLTTENGGIVYLYAQWEPDMVKVTTDKQGGTGGTGSFYERYTVDWYMDTKATASIDSISVPTQPGYDFDGYYTGLLGKGLHVTDKSGTIQAEPDLFTTDSTVYGHWRAKPYKITFDKQGGTGGTDEATAYYKKALPTATAPSREGYTFKGYYTGKNGTGVIYYDSAMAGQRMYPAAGNITLYAYWEDTSAPEVKLTVDPTVWTNNSAGVKINANAWDTGSGLSSIAIYQGDTKVAEKTGLNGVKSYTFTYNNKVEGALQFKAVATDMSGNKAESHNVAYYDVTAPKGTVTEETHTGTTLEVEVFVTDYKVK